jgi:hypothetical protein
VNARMLVAAAAICLLLGGCGGSTTTTTTKTVTAGTTTQVVSDATTHQSPVIAYGAVISAVVALAIAVSGTFAFLRRPRLKLQHDPAQVREDIVDARNRTGHWSRVRVSNAARVWGILTPRTAKNVEVIVTRLRHKDDEEAPKPVVSGRRLGWTAEDRVEATSTSIPAGTWRYLSVIGPRHAGKVQVSRFAVNLHRAVSDNRYDLNRHPGVWEAEIVVAADDIAARRWRMTLDVPSDPDGEVALTVVRVRRRRR